MALNPHRLLLPIYGDRKRPMSKVNSYFFSDPELNAFKDEVSDILNFGKYQEQLISSLPNWSARPGEQVLYTPASGGTTNYFYKGSAWISSWSVTI